MFKSLRPGQYVTVYFREVNPTFGESMSGTLGAVGTNFLEFEETVEGGTRRPRRRTRTIPATSIQLVERTPSPN